MKLFRTVLVGGAYVCALLIATSALAQGQQTINIGSAANDGTGDSLRTAFGKVNSNFATTLQKANNLSDVAAPATARINLGLGTAAIQPSTAFDPAGAAAAIQAGLGTAAAQPVSAFDPAGAATSAQAASLQKSNNLSDLSSASMARINLGLGSASTQPSTAFDAAGAAAAVQAGLGSAAAQPTTAFDVAGAASAAQTASLQKSSNLSDLASAAAARTSLGLGSAATQAASAFDVAGAAASVGAGLRQQGYSLISTAPDNLSNATPILPSAGYSGSLDTYTGMFLEVPPFNAGQLRFVYGNWWGNSIPGGEWPMPNDICFHTAAWTANSAYVAQEPIPVRFGGQKFGCVQSRSLLISDPVAVPVQAQTPYQDRTAAVVATNSQKVPGGAASTTGGANGDSPTSTEGCNAEDVVENPPGGIGATASCQPPMPVAILAYTGATPRVGICAAGDSIPAGTDDITGPHAAGWEARFALNATADNVQWPLVSPTYGFVQIARGADTVANFISTNQHEARLNLCGLASTALDDLATNDMTGGNLASLEANKLIEASLFLAQNLNYVTATLLPKDISADGFISISGQSYTPSGGAAVETEREALNNWYLDPSSAGFVAQEIAACTAGTLFCGSLPVANRVHTFDAAAAVECNSSNVKAHNGGYWCVPTSAPVYTGTVTTAGGTGGFYDTGLPNQTNNYYRGYIVRFTSGAAANTTAMVRIQRFSTQILVGNAFNAAPAVGDTYQLWPENSIETGEGIHPYSHAHALITSALQAAAAANPSLIQ